MFKREYRVICKLRRVAGVRIKYSRGLYLWNAHEIYIAALYNVMHARMSKYRVTMHFASVPQNTTQLRDEIWSLRESVEIYF